MLKDCVLALNDQLDRADFMLCASPKQRDFWLGQLAGLGRINPETYDDDENLESLLAVVPFGLSEAAPVRTAPAIKGVVPGIGADDKVILWGGGVYNWFDPLTLIRAVDRLRERRPDVRLFFLGMRHPNPDVPEMRMAASARRAVRPARSHEQARVLQRRLGARTSTAGNYLLDADIGVSCHLQHVETAFSFRTRILDYLWAGLPIVTTSGDTFGDLVEAEGLGFSVDANDVDGLEDALFQLLDDADLAAHCAKRSREVARSFTWSKVMQPLLEFCRNPRRAPDLAADARRGAKVGSPRAFLESTRPSIREDVALARDYLRQGGVSEVSRRAVGRVTRLVRQRLGRPESSPQLRR